MKIQDKLDTIIQKLEGLCTQSGQISGPVAAAIAEAAADLKDYARENLNFFEIVEHLDHSIFVTDGEGNVLYVNPAYSRNTNVQPEDVLGRNVFDIVREGKIFTGGASCDVIHSKQRVFRLSTTYKTDPPLLGYTVGVPVFGPDGELSKVVVSSHPVSTFKQLQGDFEQFVNNLEEIRKREPASTVNENSSTLENRPMIGHSAAMNDIWEKIHHVAASDATVLITGESGVGKEVVADEVYRHSLRNNRPYIKVNCAAIPASLLESELFGYEKGAFSGANTGGKAGLFELADGGTLLPEDIPELIEHFLRIYGHKYQRAITLSTGAMNILKNYRWPGNVRELENALEYLTLCCPDGDTIPEELVLDLLRQSAPDTADQPVSNLSDAVALYERTLIERALRDSKSMRAAAEALGVNVSTISRKIKQYHIELS